MLDFGLLFGKLTADLYDTITRNVIYMFLYERAREQAVSNALVVSKYDVQFNKLYVCTLLPTRLLSLARSLKLSMSDNGPLRLLLS